MFILRACIFPSRVRFNGSLLSIFSEASFIISFMFTVTNWVISLGIISPRYWIDLIQIWNWYCLNERVIRFSPIGINSNLDQFIEYPDILPKSSVAFIKLGILDWGFEISRSLSSANKTNLYLNGKAVPTTPNLDSRSRRTPWSMVSFRIPLRRQGELTFPPSLSQHCPGNHKSAPHSKSGPPNKIKWGFSSTNTHRFNC